jgi:predicted dinucleotide-utilizing enzyme
MTRVGLIGFGFIGAQVYRRIAEAPELGLEVAFVHNRNRDRMGGVPGSLILDDLADAATREADLVVEMAHPGYTRRYGAAILAGADYLPLSVTALADQALYDHLLAAARASGRRLLIPHGALMGTDNLVESRHHWREVEITFRKSPANIDFSESGLDPASIKGETVVYDGPVRGIAPLYPRNVNTMVTCALATIGLDLCRARLVAVPGLTVAVAEVRAVGRDGALLEMRKEQPVTGVSGTEMFDSQFGSILRAAGAGGTVGFV